MSSTNIQTYIDRAVQLEAEIAAAKEQLEEAKIKIQTELYAKMQNCNLNYAYASSASGRAELMIRTKLNIVDPEKAMALIGAVAEENIKVKTEPKYEIKTKFKIALTALLRMDYEEIDLKAILALLKAKPDAVEVLVKKLKGEYKKDLELLEKLKREIPEKIHFISELTEVREGTVTDSSTRFGYFILAFESLTEAKEYVTL